MNDLIALVNEQAEDPGLWCLEPTIAEHMLQQALRKLHAAVEAQCSFDNTAQMREAIRQAMEDRPGWYDTCREALSALSRPLHSPTEKTEGSQ